MKERSGKTQTVLGLVEPAVLGHTQPHEHLLCDLVPAARAGEPEGAPITLETLGQLRRHWTSNPDSLRLDSIDDAIEEMHRYRAAGGGALVDATSIGIGRDPRGLARISEATGVHVVVGAAYYEGPYHPAETESQSVEEIAESIARDVLDGVDGTGIKSGVIGEIGLGHPVRPLEDKVLRAAAVAQRETGAPVMIHPGRSPDAPLEAIRTLQRAGGDPERSIMCHIDRTLFSHEAMRELATTGCYVEFDLFGQESSFYPLAPIDMPNDATRIDHLIHLGEAGFLERLLIAQDICTKIHLTRFGGESYSHILENVVPMMELKGMSKDEIETITVRNPARVLAIA